MTITDLLPPWPLLSAFLAASFVLAATPGPGVFYIVLRSMVQGPRAGLASVTGVAAGNLGNATVAALGLAAVFAVSSLAFTLVKWAGAAYLIWLGIRMLRSVSDRPADQPEIAPLPLGRIFTDAFVVALLNPKTALFFAAFLPQFTRTGEAHALQSLALGGIFVAIAAATDTLYALTAGTVSRSLQPARGLVRASRYLAGSAFIGLGLLAAVSGQRPAR